jgi:2-polyprenyl-6-methoxyphenol hydroxylase-like FAD-dependent oxidoreductase
MLFRHEAEVLVVGAGPVGLMTALMLAERGVSVEVIDEEESTETHNYALTLHPSALQLLDDVGLANGLVNEGLRLDRVAFYGGGEPRATLRLDWLRTDFPFLLVLPRLALERALERRLKEKKVEVSWSHRLADLAEGDDEVFCKVEKLGTDSSGYSVQDTARVVVKDRKLKPKFVVGADGFHSAVRRRLDLGIERVGPPQGYAPTEFLTDFALGAEMRVMLDGGADRRSALMFPLPGGGARFTTELRGDEIPPADSAYIPIGTRLHDRLPQEIFRQRLQDLAPWYDARTTEVVWGGSIRFEPALATRFGKGRAWLVGDAAHVTGPVGVQSMNEGLREARDLASRIARVLKSKAPRTLLDEYEVERRATWRQLLGLSPGLNLGPRVDTWVAEHAERLLPCIPASGADLGELVKQIGLELEPIAT